LSQILLLLRLYVSPLKTFSRILDEGRLIFAAAAAIAVLLAIQVPRAIDYERAQTKALMRQAQARVEKAVAKAREKGTAPSSAGQRQRDDDEDYAESFADQFARMSGPPPIRLAVERFTAIDPLRYFSPLAAMAVCFVPMVILVLTLWDNLGGFSTILFRDYMALLVCCLLSWTAAHLLLLLANGTLAAAFPPAHNHAALWWGAHAYFLILSALAIRTLFGTKAAHAVGAIAGGWAGAVGGIWLYTMFGSGSAYLASPFVLYYLYLGVGPELRGLGVGLTSRQRLKQGLENATLNPRDADAHYQLGLIYAQRRQYEPAIERFCKAIEIDPNEAESYYQLGRIAREQGRYAEAIEHCRTAARLDDKHSSSEVWREIGIASLLSGDGEGARAALEKYLDRRPYDPEGECWYGRTMAKLGFPNEARAAFEQAIEAVRTMPPARKRQVRAWESEARRELKKLPASAGAGAMVA
jgi:tetratricopeptide (TPR) repeat protein